MIKFSRDVETLEMFDFDWTLFRSPLPPDNFPEKSWWASPESLRPPHVPLVPPKRYWIEEPLKEIKSSLRDVKRQPIIVTARRKQTMIRVLDLLEQKGLGDVPFFCRRSSFSLDRPSTFFKRSTVSKILEQNPYIRNLVVWEDMQKHIDELRDLARMRNVNFRFTKVVEAGNNQ